MNPEFLATGFAVTKIVKEDQASSRPSFRYHYVEEEKLWSNWHWTRPAHRDGPFQEHSLVPEYQFTAVATRIAKDTVCAANIALMIQTKNDEQSEYIPIMFPVVEGIPYWKLVSGLDREPLDCEVVVLLTHKRTGVKKAVVERHTDNLT